MNIFLTVIKLLPVVFGLMDLAEEAFKNEPASGEQKKKLVVDGAKMVIMGIQTVSTGGQRETWDIIANPLSSLIDRVVGFWNAIGRYKKADDTNVPVG